jgi:hypothetical protein
MKDPACSSRSGNATYFAGKLLACVPACSSCQACRPVRKDARVGLHPGDGAKAFRKYTASLATRSMVGVFTAG